VKLDLSDRAAIVTGGAGGFGRAYSRALAQAGARVALADIDAQSVHSAAGELAAEGLQCIGLELDVTSEQSVTAMVDSADEHLAGVDVMLHNAALMSEIPFAQPLSELSTEIWERVLRVNLTGPFLCAKAVVPHMKQRGGGKIINQSSGGAFGPSGIYGVSKLGLVSLTVSLARELAPYRINVNAIAPGFVRTEAGLRSASPELEASIKQMVPLKGWGETDDVTGALLYLASSASDWVTGQTFNIDGGWVMRI
jgi:NAD(P)-dependent dehydrogenase (short-subunit alcohol dehydrogenase family)